jgi:predicted P-loop ATPase
MNLQEMTRNPGRPLVEAKHDTLVALLSGGPWKGVFRFNVLTRRIEAANPPTKMRLTQGLLSDGDVGKILVWLSTLRLVKKDGELVGYTASASDVRLAVNTVAEDNRHNPIVEYLDSLPGVDGTPVLDSFHETILRSPDGPIASVLFKKHMVAAVRRARGADQDRSVDHQNILILCGKQNAGKTQLVKSLGGAHYVSIVGHLRDKDTILKMQGQWLVDLEEMSATKKADRNLLKSFLSRSDDYERQSYGRAAEQVARSYVLFGSSNDLTLDDPTGLRRFWCVRTGDNIDWRKARDLRDVIWAEANALAATDFDHHLSDEEAQAAAALANGYEEEDPLADRMRQELRGVSAVKSEELYKWIEGLNAEAVMPNQETKRYADSFRRIGCENRLVKLDGGGVVRVWVVPTQLASETPPPGRRVHVDAEAEKARRKLVTAG